MATSQSIPTNPRFIDLTGRRFGRMVVVCYAGHRGHSHYWHCRCDCGDVKDAVGNNLKRGLTTSCGCFHKEQASRVNRTHGMRGSPEFGVWCGIRNRCYNPKVDSYCDYGGRGIAVCERWRRSFKAFLADMGLRPSPRHTIERLDNSRDYEPTNCVWATPSEQAKNRRTTVFLTHDGVTLCVKDWGSRLHINPGTIANRIRRGYSVADALSTKPLLRGPKSLKHYVTPSS